MNSFSFKRGELLRSFSLVLLLSVALLLGGCEESSDPGEPPRTLTIGVYGSAIISVGEYNDPGIIDSTQTLGLERGDRAVFISCKIVGGCSDTLSFEYFSSSTSTNVAIANVYKDLPERITLASLSHENLFQDNILACKDVSTPLIVAAPVNPSLKISTDFSDESKVQCVYSKGRVLYVSGWQWDDEEMPSISDIFFTNCEGFTLWCVRDLAQISIDPNFNDDFPTESQSGDFIIGTTSSAHRVNMLADWIKRWFDIENSVAGTLQALALVRAFAEDLGEPGIDCEWGMGRVDSEFFAPLPMLHSITGELDLYQLSNRTPITIAYLSEKLEEKGFTGTFKKQLAKLEWRYRNEANATDSDKEDGYGEVLEFPDCS